MLAAANSFRQILRDLRGQKLRTFLTVCGIVWGTVAVSLLLAFGQGFHRQLIKDSRGLGTDIVIAWPSRTSISYEGLGKGRQILLTERDIELLRKKATTLDMISAEFYDNLKLQLGRRILAVDVAGVEPPFGEMRNVIAAAGGRFLNPIDEDLKRRVAFLGNDLSEELFGSADPVGQYVRLNSSPFLIIGVMQPKTQNSNYSGNDKGKLFIPASTLRALTGQKYINNFIFTASDVTMTDAAIRDVRGILASKHRFHPDDEQALQIWDTTGAARFLDTFMLAFQLFLGIVGSLTLVVGGIGVSNIMNVVVEERTREIGIKMALGARGRAVLAQFMLETMVLTAIGGGIGLAISFGICAAFPTDFEEFVGIPTLSPSLTILTACVLGLVGLVAGYFPARAASRLDPVVAMKL